MKCHDTRCHSMPVATATVAWNLRAQRDNRTLPRLRKKRHLEMAGIHRHTSINKMPLSSLRPLCETIMTTARHRQALIDAHQSPKRLRVLRVPCASQ